MRSSLFILATVLISFATHVSAAGAFGVVLERKDEQLQLVFGASDRVPLATRATAAESCGPLNVQSARLNAALPAELITFALSGQNHAVRAIAALAVRTSAGWTVQQEWTVDKREDDAGSKDETQSFGCDASGVLTRRVHRMNVDNIPYLLPCKCCTAIQTKTMETIEEETFAWNDATRSLQRRSYRKWYVTQYGEGLVNVARKALGDPSRLGHLYALNPELKHAASLTEGQRVLVEKIANY